MVAVRMVSEGVDVPRLSVGVYATSTSTPLFFAQAVGRFVRARRRGETASVFLPSVPVDPQPRRDDGGGARPRPRPAADRRGRGLAVGRGGGAARRGQPQPRRAGGLEDAAFEALESDAHFDHVLFDAQQFGLHAAVGLARRSRTTSGCPGLLEPDQVPPCSRSGRAGRSAEGARGGRRARHPAVAGRRPHRALAAQRKELNRLVAAYSPKTGMPHANVHMDLRRACGGPDLAAASCEQVLERIERIRLWFVGRR